MVKVSFTYCQLLTPAWHACRMDGPMPSLSAAQWRLLVSACIGALAVSRLPLLQACLPKVPRQDAASRMHDPQTGQALPEASVVQDTSASSTLTDSRQGDASEASAWLAAFLLQNGFELHHWFALVDLLTCPDL